MRDQSATLPEAIDDRKKRAHSPPQPRSASHSARPSTRQCRAATEKGSAFTNQVAAQNCVRGAPFFFDPSAVVTMSLAARPIFADRHPSAFQTGPPLYERYSASSSQAAIPQMFPLSAAQTDTWYGQKLDPDSACYSVGR
jgi:hypothetical protein